ncbi:hypothetical protein NE237_018847 [Protea cynaroides]|uniref:Uncharacterized protein n=1 Tax=Protea cynaroides TaxID=273540 RepID=A0A9Q0KAL4_9MAGN|nr:hypothetical protein NE237_018847 [Protea cynaroides]
MLHRCKRHATTNDGINTATRREKGAKASNKKKSDQSDKSTKPNKKNKKAKFEKPATRKTGYPGPPAYPNPKAYHPLNKPSSEIMHIKMNDPLLVQPHLRRILNHMSGTLGISATIIMSTATITMTIGTSR